MIIFKTVIEFRRRNLCTDAILIHLRSVKLILIN